MKHRLASAVSPLLMSGLMLLSAPLSYGAIIITDTSYYEVEGLYDGFSVEYERYDYPASITVSGDTTTVSSNSNGEDFHTHNREIINGFEFGRYDTSFTFGRFDVEITDSPAAIDLTGSFSRNVFGNGTSSLTFFRVTESSPGETSYETIFFYATRIPGTADFSYQGPDLLEPGLYRFAITTGLLDSRPVRNEAYTGSWNYNLELTAVPVPPAAWLFGSAFLGLAGLRRK